MGVHIVYNLVHYMYPLHLTTTIFIIRTKEHFYSFLSFLFRIKESLYDYHYVINLIIYQNTFFFGEDKMKSLYLLPENDEKRVLLRYFSTILFVDVLRCTSLH